MPNLRRRSRLADSAPHCRSSSTARGCSRSRPSTKRAHPGASSSSSCAAPAVRMERWGVRSVPAAGRAAGVPIGRVPAAAAAAAMPPVVAFGGRVCVSQGKVSVSIVTLCHCTSIRTLTCTPRLRCAAADRCAHHSTPSGAHPTTHPTAAVRPQSVAAAGAPGGGASAWRGRRRRHPQGAVRRRAARRNDP